MNPKADAHVHHCDCKTQHHNIKDTCSLLYAKQQISNDVFILTFECPEIAAIAQPGNFVNIKINHATQPLLRRPFSIHNIHDIYLDVMVKRVGSGSSLLCEAALGTHMMILGPLGNSFNLSDNSFHTAVLVSGGIGTAPMLFLEKALEAQGKKFTHCIGGRTQNDLLSHRLSHCLFATDDGSIGFHGTVVDLLRHELPQFVNDASFKVFACGPNPMLKALARFCMEQQLPCELSLESVMGCGIGICYGCCIEIKESNGTQRTMLLCKEGPVIDATLFID